jgi:hypothetical protein
MSGLSLQELDAQFSELLPEREALGCINLKIPGHHVHHHHPEPRPCEPKQAPCPPHDGGHDGGHGGHDGGRNGFPFP